MSFDLDLFESMPVLGIIRGVKSNCLHGVVEASLAGGLSYLEITQNTPDYINFIKIIDKDYPEAIVGAGTVLSVVDAKMAFDAGAKFLVAPDFNEDISRFCLDKKLAYFPGALTPTEIQKAWNSGATMVKIFPASQMGPTYFKQVKGPFDKVKLMAVGGVNPKNIKDYLGSGADAVALGASIYSLKRMENKLFNEIQNDIEDFMLEVKKFYAKIATIGVTNR
jgi:2-dehydro-3-deoxyphosphogluconate aldolase/(4S)-4-hydroxy-2-oxoglutarate aldolase